jgi:hypothetical protein
MVGKDQIRAAVEYSVAHDDEAEARNIQSNGDNLSWTVHVRQGDNVFDLPVKAVVRDGKFDKFILG